MRTNNMHVFRSMEVDVRVHESGSLSGVLMPVQCHSNVVKVIQEETDDRTQCDALVTTNKALMFGVHTRDCAPICITDKERIAVAHVGWQGLCKGMIEAVMMHFDSSVTEVFVGPHLHTFEIQKDFCYEAITAKFGERFIAAEDGRLIFHFKDAIASLLPQHVVFDSRNTMTDTLLPSHRHKRVLGHIITTAKLR